MQIVPIIGSQRVSSTCEEMKTSKSSFATYSTGVWEAPINYAIEGGSLFGASARPRKLSATDIRKQSESCKEGKKYYWEFGVQSTCIFWEGRPLESMIPPLRSATGKHPSRIKESRVRSPVCPVLSLPTK